jgi:hypothetical protein
VKCRSVQKHLPLFSGGDIPLLRQKRLQHHLRICEACRTELGKLQKTRELARHSLLQKEISMPDKRLWEQILYKLPKETRQKQKLSRREKTSRLQRLVPVMVGAAAFVIILLIVDARQTADRRIKPKEPLVRNYPVVENVERPGITVLTFQTDDPKVTIVWFFEDEPKQKSGGQNETST